MSPLASYSSLTTSIGLISRPTVLVLGTGIRGGWTAAYLAASGLVDVIVIDPFAAGCGISSTNHGRFHAGVWNFLSNTQSAIERSWRSLELIRLLPGVWECSKTGNYCILHPDQVGIFEDFFGRLGKRFSRTTDFSNISSWIDPTAYTLFNTDETSFNPASLAAQLVTYADSTRNSHAVHGAAKRLSRRNGRFVVTLSDGRSVEGDAVVNTMGGWMNSLESELDLWRPDLMWSGWRLLCLNAAASGIEPLNRVITIDRANGDGEGEPGPVAAVPHSNGWVIFGCDMPAQEMTSQDQVPPGEDWRRLNRSEAMDDLLYSSHAEHFPLLSRLLKTNPEAMYTFRGVYPEVKSADSAGRLEKGTPTPYRGLASWTFGGEPGYYPIFGGSATTAVLDAKEACQHIFEGLHLSTSGSEEWIHRIADGLPPASRSGMIWEHRRTPCFSLA